MEIHERLKCLGWFGFGSGFASAAELHNRASEHCSASCPAREACRTSHEARVRAYASADYADQLEQMPDELRAIVFDAALPQLYVISMSENLRDGIALAISGAPVWRGERTIPLTLPHGGN